jgi:hypothetical protein
MNPLMDDDDFFEFWDSLKAKMSDTLTELRDVIETDVKGGFMARDEIMEAGIDYLLGDYDYDWIEAQVDRLTNELLSQHYETQKAWVGETDCDRLDEAFAELDRNGIVARQNFKCCQTCGHAEISYEIEATEAFRPVRGYVFFHMQDTESAVRNGYLYLAYGSLSGEPQESKVVADEIVTTLKKHGLEADWNGAVKTRIAIREITWQRRRLVFGGES